VSVKLLFTAAVRVVDLQAYVLIGPLPSSLYLYFSDEELGCPMLRL